MNMDRRSHMQSVSTNNITPLVQGTVNETVETVITRVRRRSKVDIDLYTRLRHSRLGLFYMNHLKQNVGVRAVVLWVWRNCYPLYLKYFSFSGTSKWKRLIRLSDYMAIHSSDTYPLFDSRLVDAPVKRVLPVKERQLFDSSPQSSIFPQIQVAVLHDAVQYGGTNLVSVGDEVIHHELYDFKRDSTSEELHGRMLIDSKRNRVRWLQADDTPYEIPLAASFVDACAGNYAHWMTEVLSRITLFCMNDRFRSIPIIVNDGLHKNIMASLFLVADGREIIILPIGRAVKVKELYLTSVTGYVPFQRRNRAFQDHSHGLFSPEALTELSHLINQKISNVRGRLWPEKIFLRRNSGTRKISNAADIEQLMIAYDYTVVEPENLSFDEQVLIFRNAKSIVGATGAAFASCIFCCPDTDVTILMSKHEDMIYRYWSNMLAPLGIKVNYILGNIVDNQFLGLHGDFQVDEEDVITFLESTGNTKRKPPTVHPTAQVALGARLGDDVEIGPFSVIHSNVILGDRVKIGGYCELGVPTALGDGSPLMIGDDALIRSHSIFYESSSFGAGLVTGHRVTVRENTVAGTAFQIGTLSEIQGDCTIGNYVRFQSNVFVGKKTTIGNFVWILPYVVLTNDPTPPSDYMVGCTIEDFASIAATAIVLPGVTVGHHALVAAQACVTKDVLPNKVVAGAPARVVKETTEILLRDGSGRPAYPWTRHFTRGYPEAVVAEWANVGKDNI